MKNSFLLLLATSLLSANSFAAPRILTCQLKTEGNLIEEETIKVSLDEKSLQVNLDFFGKVELVTGTFIKVAKNGSLVYETPDITQLIDQSDIGFTFVDAKLLNGGQGKIDFSARQLGDSEGSWWVKETFFCK